MKGRMLLPPILAALTVGGAVVWQFVIRPIQPAWFPPSRNIASIFTNTTSTATNGALSTVNSRQVKVQRPVDFPLTLPDGFVISLFTKGIENARVLALDPNGVMLVSSPKSGKVFALPDRNNDGLADETKVILEGLNKPHGLAFRDGFLYVAETDGVSRWSYDTSKMSADNREKLFSLPAGEGHFTRTIRFGSNGKLYTTVGSSCNVCREDEERRGAMLVSDADGKNLRVFARGLRNTVFFTIHPTTGEIWGADMGRDWLGDNLPPEDVNIIRDGKHYGWPYCYGTRIHDDDFDPKRRFDCSATEPPIIEMQAHSAPLGIAFIPDGWGPEYDGDLLISFHGSWNRSVPTGYRVIRYDLSGQKPVGPIDFLSGFLEDGGSLGRPVDLLFDRGTLFISDDKAGAVYRITKTSG